MDSDRINLSLYVCYNIAGSLTLYIIHRRLHLLKKEDICGNENRRDWVDMIGWAIESWIYLGSICIYREVCTHIGQKIACTYMVGPTCTMFWPGPTRFGTFISCSSRAFLLFSTHSKKKSTPHCGAPVKLFYRASPDSHLCNTLFLHSQPAYIV